LTAPSSPRCFTGQIEKPELGLYFYNARWYDPALGRFTQPDSLIPQPGSLLGWDRYAYTLNTPILNRAL
jgi:RHS repeat-associated protein